VPNRLYQEMSIAMAEADAKVASLAARVSEAEAQSKRAREIALAIPKVEAEYIQLNRDYDSNKQNYEKLLQRRDAARLAGNAVAMLFNSVLTHRPQLFSDVRTYWSPEAVERVTGYKLEGRAENGFIDLRNSGATTLNATGEEKDAEGNPIIKHWWEITEADIEADLKASTFHAATREYFPGGGFSTHFTTACGMPWDRARVSADNPVEHVESYRGKRVFLVSGTESDRYESVVLPSQQSFEKALDGAGIGYERYEDTDRGRYAGPAGRLAPPYPLLPGRPGPGAGQPPQGPVRAQCLHAGLPDDGHHRNRHHRRVEGDRDTGNDELGRVHSRRPRRRILLPFRCKR